MSDIQYGAGLTLEARLARLEQMRVEPKFLQATQTGIIGITGGINSHLTGAKLTLTSGTWLVTGMFLSGRVWHTGTGYASCYLRGYLTGGGGSVIRGNGGDHLMFGATVNCEHEQHGEMPPVTLHHVVTVGVSETYDVELWGGAEMLVSTNFASGWRWDSGIGRPSKIIAVRIG